MFYFFLPPRSPGENRPRIELRSLWAHARQGAGGSPRLIIFRYRSANKPAAAMRNEQDVNI